MGFLLQPLSFFSIGPTRSFGGISGYVTIQETTTDTLQITQQPVQQGAAIADHSFKNPVQLSIQMQFQNSLIESLKDVYDSLQTLQNSLEPFTVFTPKRTYENMLFSSLGLTTDKRTEFVLAINASFQQVIIVNVGIVTIPRSNLKDPGTNGATQKAGRKSALKTLAQGIGLSK